jgi:hypothetical protein
MNYLSCNVTFNNFITYLKSLLLRYVSDYDVSYVRLGYVMLCYVRLFNSVMLLWTKLPAVKSANTLSSSAYF